jgi:hypothetical protein
VKRGPILYALFLQVSLSVAAMVLACGSSGGKASHTRVAEVLSGRDCSSEQCVSLTEASAQVGFPILIPEQLPSGFSLFSRGIMPFTSAPTFAVGASAPAVNVAPQYASLALDYRFQGSPNVPGILITERLLPRVDGLPDDRRRLTAEPGCAESINSKAGAAFYVQGVGSTQEDDAGQLHVCKTDERSAHYAALLDGDVLIEVLAFPESNVSKQDFVDLLKSLQLAE